MIAKEVINKYINNKFNNKIIIFDTIDSTNDYLLNYAQNNLDNTQTVICIATEQTKGRGQWDRSWFSPANNIYLSILKYFNKLFYNLNHNNLSIKIANNINNKLVKIYNINNAIVKYPNDILYNNHKLAGILTESRKNYAVIGVGLNIELPQKLPANINNAISLTEILQFKPDLNQVAAMLIEAILDSLENNDNN